MIKSEKGWVYTDRLGSIGKFYPYGVERPSATANGTEKFTGYFRDAETGLDYADQRYESPGTGRFLTRGRIQRVYTTAWSSRLRKNQPDKLIHLLDSMFWG
jgi:RHS repeat-associated protein